MPSATLGPKEVGHPQTGPMALPEPTAPHWRGGKEEKDCTAGLRARPHGIGRPAWGRRTGRVTDAVAAVPGEAADTRAVRRDKRKDGVMVKTLSSSLILRGVLAIVVGVLALAWPGITVLALVILFAVYAFMAGGLQAMLAFSSERAGPVIGPLLLGLACLAAGVIALAWPGPTAYVLVLVVATWAVVVGLFELFAALQHGETAGTRALFTLSGLVSIALGVVLFAHPRIGAFALALLFGLFTLIYGAWALVSGIELRHQDRKAEPDEPRKTPHWSLRDRHAA